MPLCVQCGRLHRLHGYDALYGVMVTEDPEMYHACVAHNRRSRCNMFRKKLIKAGVIMHKFVPIKTILVNDGGVFADNYTWLQILIERVLDCRTIFFLNVGTSFLLLGGKSTDLINHNMSY